MKKKQIDDEKALGSSNEQFSKFLKTAKELGCDESESAFDAGLSTLAKQTPAPKPVKKEKPSK